MVDQPRSKGGFDLKDYVEVKDRIRLFYERWPTGALVTGEVRISVDDDTPRVIVQAFAYRTPDDPHPGVGWSWLELPGKTSYTKGSELENAETSAWGRAIGSTGIGIDKSIASPDEIKNKAGGELVTDVTTGETSRSLGPIERSGAIARGSGRHSDLEWRQTPDGYHIGFLLEVGDGKAKPQVSIEGPLAVAVFAAQGNAPLLGLPVTVRGEAFEVSAPQRRKFYRIVADYIETPEWKLPAPVEAETVPLGLVEDDLSGLPEEWAVPNGAP